MIGAADRLFLRRAVELAEHGLYSVSGNPRVGCVIVRDGNVIGRGWHQRAGGPHAETHAIANADGDVRGATAYVSLEPCCHTGRQPPCVEALISHGVARVVVALVDPDPRVAGRGCEALRGAGIEVDVEDLPAAAELNAGYLKRVSQGMPWVRLKVASSLDGRTAMASGESQWITSPAARADAQHWRARSSAIVTGIGTVLADDPALTVREERFAGADGIRQPLVAIADRRGRTPPGAKLFAADRPVILFCCEDAPTHHPRAQVVAGNRAAGLHALLEHLAAQGCDEVLVEAGPTLIGAFLRAALWDEALVYLAPKLLGSEALPLARLTLARLADCVAARVVAVDSIGPDVRVVLRRVHAERV